VKRVVIVNGWIHLAQGLSHFRAFPLKWKQLRLILRTRIDLYVVVWRWDWSAREGTGDSVRVIYATQPLPYFPMWLFLET